MEESETEKKVVTEQATKYSHAKKTENDRLQIKDHKYDYW